MTDCDDGPLARFGPPTAKRGHPDMEAEARRLGLLVHYSNAPDAPEYELVRTQNGEVAVKVATRLGGLRQRFAIASALAHVIMAGGIRQKMN
jgi:hypothetical protein